MRPLRKLKPGAIYHVVSKINRRAMDLQSAQIKAMLLVFINKAKLKYPFQLLNFCIMDNHIHLIIKPGKGQSLSKIMQWIKGNFARYWNKVHHTEGHLWGERFFSKIIENVAQFFRVFKYIDDNPVAAQMVPKAEDWEFGGLYHHLHRRLDVIDIPRSALLGLFFGIGC
ncbi:MAG: transposase [Treponema sp.]|jgi:putative transposase|nr:transposase [Treponema sp.]